MQGVGFSGVGAKKSQLLTYCISQRFSQPSGQIVGCIESVSIGMKLLGIVDIWCDRRSTTKIQDR